MPRQAMLGNRLRRLRREHGLTQVAMAGQLGISPSYLNLIEHNQRALNRPLLLKLSERYEVDIGTFSGTEEARLLADLTELFGDPLFREVKLRDGELNDLVGAAPGVCRAVLTLYRAYRNVSEDIRGLSERLAQDPYLSNSSHQLLTLLTSIRSFAEILHDNVDLAAARRKQFVAVLVEESEKLTDLVNQLFDFITGDGLRGLQGAESPGDEVIDAVHRAGNHFPEIEQAAERARQETGITGTGAPEALWAALAAHHGLSVAFGPDGTGAAPEAARGTGDHGLRLPETLPPESVAFQVAQHVALLSQRELIERHMAQAQLSTVRAGDMYRRVLAAYFAGALLMPYEEFHQAARRMHHDIELLGRRFGTSFEQVCHRLTTLHRPGAEGVPFHFVRADIAGNISKRFNGSGLRIPRYGGACPRWNLHAAFMNPGRIDRQLARLPDGTTYFNIARHIAKPGDGFGAPASHYSICIGCEVSFARQLVYADGLALDDPRTAVPVGLHCRLCERRDCRQRAFPSLVR
jgi:predicted transcriptional regulator/transcriptional regulator with XRE-family HTH domain